MPHDRQRAIHAFKRLAHGVGAVLHAQDVDGYTTPGLEPGDVEYVDTDWSGSDAEASYPNPSDDDTDLQFLSDHYLFSPDTLPADDPPLKSAFKGPIRQGPGGPVNVRALLATIQAINGARGGFDGVSTDTLQAGYDFAVDHLVAAGFYDDADEAPDFEAEASEHGGDSTTDSVDFSPGDTVTWGDGDADVFGIIRDEATSGDDVFSDRIDGDFALSPTEDNPGYLVETLDETADGWVPSGTMTGHRGETLQPWDPDKDVMDDDAAASMPGVTRATAAGDTAFDSHVRVHGERLTSSLKGVIWGAGDHDLALGGTSTPVRVPPDTIRPTFDALQDDVDSGDVGLGFDHPNPDSVAAQTGLVEIGTATSVALTDDGRNIALTDSELTNDNAVEAAENGDFDDLDWSIVADVAVRRDGSGDIVREDGRVVIDAVRITRIDAVDTGAVDAATIVRDADALPNLSDQTDTVRNAAASPGDRQSAVAALEASAAALSQTMNDITTDVSDLDEAREQLEAAASVISDQEDELTTARAKADAFAEVLQAHGKDLDDFDSAEAAAQAVMDEQTADVREQIAELESELAAYDVDDVEARAADLAGDHPDNLRNTLNARKAEKLDRVERKREKGRATASKDRTGRVDPTGGSGASGGQDADELALGAMSGTDRIQAEANGESPAEYVRNEYDVDPSRFDASDELHAEIMDGLNGGDA